MTILDK